MNDHLGEKLINQIKRQNDLKVLEIQLAMNGIIGNDSNYIRDYTQKRLIEIETKYEAKEEKI